MVGDVLGFSICIPASMGEAWFPRGCLLFPLFAQSRGQASGCVQPPACTLLSTLPEHTAGRAHMRLLGSLEKDPFGRSGLSSFRTE